MKKNENVEEIYRSKVTTNYTDKQKCLNKAIESYQDFFQAERPIINLNLNNQQMFSVTHIVEGSKSELHYIDMISITNNSIEIHCKLISVRFFDGHNQITNELKANELNSSMREYKKVKPMLKKVEKKSIALFQSILTSLGVEQTPSQVYQR